MHAADAAWVFADLERMGALSSVQLERLVTTGRNARGHKTATPTPVGIPFGIYLTARRETLVRAAMGEHAAISVAAVCPPGTELAVDDELEVLSGPRTGQRFRVLGVPEGEGPVAPVLAALERMRAVE